jgi:hypothetical protein
MDIKKFISSDKIDGDYNKLIQNELDAIKSKSNERSNKTKCLYGISKLDFLKPTKTLEEIIKDDNISDFEAMCIQDVLSENALAYSGPMIKKYLDPWSSTDKNTKPIVRNYYNVTLIDQRFKSKNLLKAEYKKNMIEHNGHYLITTKYTSFYLDKKVNLNLSSYVLSNNDCLDRIALNNGELWLSGMFILEFYKRISCYDNTIVDPVFEYPEDILDIYDKTMPYESPIKHMIDMTDREGIEALSREEIENILITDHDQRYTIIEYVMLKMMEPHIHPVIVYQMKTIILYLTNFHYLRPPFLVAKMLDFDKEHPAIYEALKGIIHKINIDSEIDIKSDTRSLSTIYHIDMYILNHIIKMDDDDQFVDYVSKMNIVKKFKQESKTSEKLIDWIVEYKPIKIIRTLIDSAILSDKFRYKIIFLTQEFNLLGKEFLTLYVLKKPYVPSEKHPKIVNTNENDNNNDNDDNNNGDNNNGNDNNGNDNSNNTKETDNLEKNTSVLNGTNDYVCNDEKLFELNNDHQLIILSNLREVLNRGITRSFYLMLKLSPHIIKSDFFRMCVPSKKSLNKSIETKPSNNTLLDSGNILHLITSDKAMDILEIIVKKNPSLLDDKDDQGRTPLIHYAELGLGKLIEKIIGLGADYEITDNKSETFLHKLCKNGNTNIVQNVIRNVTKIIDIKNEDMMTPAIIAALNKHEEIFYILKGVGADLDIHDTYGNTVYHYICRSRICPGMLIVNKKNRFGFTPYDYCKIDHKFYYFQK